MSGVEIVSKQKAALSLRPIALGVLLACGGSVWANPAGQQVAAGSATFNSVGKTLTVTNTPGTILNWQSFSIGAGELTRFQQQSALSAVLNRVTGANPSSILGTLSSNGRVFLVNPHGIVFGAGSTINTAGFVASTLNISDADFLAGRLKFEGGGNGVLRNEGAIRASGDIFLVGTQIENAGLIKSDNGSVLLAAGQSVTITSPDAQGVQFALQAPTDAVLNLGIIEAGNAASLFAGTLKHSGDIRATSASVDARGRVILAAQTDAIVAGNATIDVDNSAGRGGSVQITGERVGLFDNATVTARGATGGGEILVGGDHQGKNPDVRNAARTFVAKDATLRADATANGDGGKVIVWADDVTRYFGHASVQGGTLGGNGGLIEVSGKNVLVFDGTVGLDALKGKGGTLLLDPLNITVQAGAGTLDAFLSVPGDPLLAFAEPSNVFDGTLNVASLQAFTTGTVELQANNDISFNAAVTMQSGVTLKAAAMNNVNVNANITTSGGGALLLEADTDLSGAGRVNLAAVTIDGPLTIGKAGVPLSGNATLVGNAILAQDAQVLGSLALPAGRTLTINTGKTLTVAGGMTANTGFFAPATITGGGTLVIPTAQTLLFTSSDTQAFSFDNVTVNNAGTFQLAGSFSNATLLNNSAVFNNQIGGQILFSQPGNAFSTSSGIGTLNNSGTIASSGANATLSMGVFNANGGSIFSAVGGSVIRNAGSSSYDGSLTLNNALRLTGGTHVFADGVTLNGTGSLVHDGATTVTMNNVTANVPYALTSGDTLTLAAGKTLTVASGMTANTGFFAPVTITGGGTLAIPTAQSLLFTSSDPQAFTFNNVTVNNAGTFQLAGSFSNATLLNNNAVFNNQAGGQILFSQPGNAFSTSAGIGTLNNSGTIASSGGNNATLTMGVFNANNGSIFTTGAGSVIRNAGSSTYTGSLTLNSALRLTGGTHVFADGMTLNGTGSLVHDGATAVTMNNVTANVPYALTSGDTLTLAAGKTLTVAGGMTANTGFFAPATITGGGTLVIPTAQTLLFTSSDTQAFSFDNVTVNNAGTFQLAGSFSNATLLNNSAVFNNQIGGQILFSQPGNAFSTSAGIGTLNNSGTIAAAGGDIAINVPVMTNSGLFDVTAGNASISSGLALLAGSIDVGATRTVNIAGTGLDWQGGTLTGLGTYTLSSLTITGSGSRVLDGPTLSVANLNLPGGSLDVQAGTLNLSGTTSIAAGATLAFSGGALNLGGALDNAGIFDVNAGVFNLGNGGNASGTFDAAPGATINFSGGTHSLADGTALGGGGNFAYTGGTLDINGGITGTTVAAGTTLSANGQTFGGAGKLVNLGTFNLANSTVSGSVDNQGTFNASGASAINGATLDLTAGALDLAAGGTLTKGGGAVNWIGSTITGTGALTGGLIFTGGGARVLNGPTLNLGATTLPAGTLTLQGGALNFGGIATIASGATLDVAGGTVTGALSIDVQGLLKMSGGVLNAASVGTVPGGTLSGTGTVNAPITNGGTVAVGASPGTLIINGNYAQTPTGILDIELGGTTQGVNYDLLQVTGTAALNGTLNVALFGGFVGAAGNVFDVLTYASRSGDFATVNFPAGYTMTATPNAALYQLAMSAVPGGGGGGGGGASIIDTEIKPPATEVTILNDKFITAALDPDKPAEDEEKKGTVLECK